MGCMIIPRGRYRQDAVTRPSQACPGDADTLSREWHPEPRCRRCRWPTGLAAWPRRKTLTPSTKQVGADTRKQILRMLPPGYELEGRRLLDFGCGAGRTLRHFLDDADSAEIWGCDIDQESIDWLEHNLCPPLHVVRNEAAPGLPFEDGHFDVVWALSVFTHLAGRRLGGVDARASSRSRRRRDPDRDLDRSPPFRAVRQGALGGGPHRHERASPLGLLGCRRARGPSLHLVAAGALGPSLRDPRDRRVADGGHPIAGSRCESATSPSRSRIWSARSPASRASSPPRATTPGSCGASSSPYRRAGEAAEDDARIARLRRRERLSRLRRGGRPVFSRQQVRRVLGDEDGRGT